jgi:hypothetical protein
MVYAMLSLASLGQSAPQEFQRFCRNTASVAKTRRRQKLTGTHGRNRKD